MNEYLEDFIAAADDMFSDDALNMSMTEWITTNTTLKGRPFSVAEHEFQRQIIDDTHQNMCVVKPSQVGLALDLDTPIITPKGWTTIGDLTVKDVIYDEQGKRCNVQYVSPTYLNRECYKLEFDDGNILVADANHRWYVECDKAFHEHDGLYDGHGRIPKGSGYVRNGIIRTSTLAKQYSQGTKNLFAIPNTKPLKGGSSALLIDPYYLGLWLGDGHAYSTRITCGSNDVDQLQQLLEQRNFICVKKPDPRGPFDLKVDNPGETTLYNNLNTLNVLKNKHIPPEYLQASKSARLELLRGLLDSDGSITKRGRCSFHNTNKLLVTAVEDLLCSLGFKCRTRWRIPEKVSYLKNGYPIVSKKPIAEVSFVAYSNNPVFNLERKRCRQRLESDCRSSEVHRRRIVKVTKVPSRPVRCITVDSPKHLYLAGRGMIPTHNTELQIRKALGFLVRNQGTSLIFSLPTEDMFKRISKARVKPLVDKDAVFNSKYDRENKAVRSADMMQFGQSFLYLVPAIESAATSIDADIVMNDEIDLSDQKMITLFNSRLQGSKIAISQRFSTPTFPNFGIDLDYQASDQHEYPCQCSSCNHYNFPKFNRKFMNIPGLPDEIRELHKITVDMQDVLDLENAYVMCEKCGAALDLNNTDRRQWVAKYPSRSQNSRGYKITPFVTARLDPKYIIKSLWNYQKTEFTRGFFNTVLGEAYADGSIQIPREMIEQCMTTHIGTMACGHSDKVWVGIDMGQTCHIIIGKGPDVDHLHIIDMLSVHVDDVVEKVREICKLYNVCGGSVDRHPYEPTAREVFAASGGKILPVEYRGSKEFNPIKNDHGNVTHGQVDRTWFLDQFALLIRKNKIKISGYGYNKETYIVHLRDMVRDEAPDKPAVWKKLTNNDHFFHASAFMALGPKIVEILNLRDKQDPRLMTGFSVTSTNRSASNLVGFHTGD